MKTFTTSLTLGLLLTLSACGDYPAEPVAPGSPPASGAGNTAGNGANGDPDPQSAGQAETPKDMSADTDLDAGTHAFVRAATSSNLLEIRSSELALDRSENNDVSGFAQQMIEDHRRVGDQMRSVLNAQAQTSDDQALTALHAQKLSELENADSATFDAQYMRLQTEAHREAVDLFSQYAGSGSHPELRAFASQTLPSLQTHLEMAEEMDIGPRP